MSRCGYQSLIYVFFAWILAACGGGGGGGVDPSSGNVTNGGSSLNTISLSLLNNSGQPISSITNNAPGILSATITNSSGEPVQGEVVTFSLAGSIGSLNPTSGTALTNSSGIASITLNAGTEPGSSSATATSSTAIPTINGLSSSNTVTFSSDGSDPDNTTGESTAVGTSLTLQVLKSDGTTYDFTNADPALREQVSQNLPATLLATLSDLNGPLVGEVVNFSTTLGSLSLTNDLTNVNGQASVTLDTGAIPGTGIASVSYSGTTSTATFLTAGDNTTGSTIPSDIAATLTQLDGTTPLTNNQVTASTPGLLTFTLTKSGSPRSSQILQVSLEFGNAVLDGANASGVATIITDSSGQATVQVNAGQLTGAESVTVTGDGVTETSILNFDVQASDIQLGTGSGVTFVDNAISVAGSQPLPAGTSTTISVNLVDANNSNSLYTTPTQVNFTSDCANQNKARIDPVITSFNGTATATYIPNGDGGSCAGSDTITVSALVASQTPNAQGTITISAADAASIQQDGDANPKLIRLANTSGLNSQTSSIITFLILDENGSPVDNSNSVSVSFELTTTVGGITLSQASQTTDANGQVQVQVNSGTVPTPVRVRAFFTDGSGQTISTVSDQLSIGTGIPDQNSFSLSVSSSSIQGWSTNLQEVTLTASGADQFNNLMPIGTNVQFTSELGGASATSCEVTDDTGSCSVVWRTTGERAPADQTAGVTVTGRNDRFGRSTVVAYLLGEESFTDQNSNNMFDTGELFADMPEVFIDLNESGVRDATFNPPTSIDPDTNAAWQAIGNELHIDSAGGTVGVYDTENTFYDGTLCNSAGINDCVNLINVRKSNVIVSATDQLRFYVFQSSGFDDSSLEYIEQGTHAAPTPPSTALNTVLHGISVGGVQLGVNNTTSPYNPTLTTVSDIDFTGLATSASLVVYVSDLNGNAPPSGTTLNFNCSACDVAAGSSGTTANSTEPQTFNVTLAFNDSDDDGVFTVEYTLPNGATFGGDFSIVVDN